MVCDGNQDDIHKEEDCNDDEKVIDQVDYEVDLSDESEDANEVEVWSGSPGATSIKKVKVKKNKKVLFINN